MNRLIDVILSSDAAIRDQSLDAVCADASLDDLLAQCRELDEFRRQSDNLYHRVRALFFLAAIYRYHLPSRLPVSNTGLVPFAGHEHLLERRFQEAIDCFLTDQEQHGPSAAIASCLAEAYHQLAFQTLADQVRRSVRTVRGNQWMFRIGHPDDHPLRIRRELLNRGDGSSPSPLLCERTSVRMDFSHSAWSDIFFLGMDFPEGARVLNVSVDLGVRGRDDAPQPPIETYLRVIDQPVLRLVSTDLGASTDITSIPEMFDFARDYLGLLKAAVIAAGLVPPGLEGCDHPMSDLLSRMVGPGLGLEVVSKVNDIPKGSRLAVSTNLLGSLISICMRATGQVSSLTGGLEEADRRIVAARAILGEWIGGSGGGWQDSGGVWPGIKLIQGAAAEEGDPEHGISRGRLLPEHTVFDEDEVSAETRKRLQDSLVLVHGGMAQNVGPILEMVTEKYLLRSEPEWTARGEAMSILDDVVEALREGDVEKIGSVTTRNFHGPLQTIIPWATNRFTDLLIEHSRKKFGEQFWGFWMLGGMAGGGMGFIFDPDVKAEAQDWLQQTMSETKRELQTALPFAMEPVVYDFAINDRGSWAELQAGDAAMMPDRYYGLLVPGWLKREARDLSPQTRWELEQLGETCRDSNSDNSTSRMLLDRMLPRADKDESRVESLHDLLETFGFDREQHEQICSDLRAGRVGLSQNRLPSTTEITDVKSEDVIDVRNGAEARYVDLGKAAIRGGEVAVVTLAAGVGSRWTEGAGVCKALHPFCKFDGRHRNFLEVHLAKTRKSSREHDGPIPHVFTTGYLTDAPIREHLEGHQRYGFEHPLFVSPGRAVGLRTVPMVRDLRFAWEEMPQQVLDAQQQKVRESLRAALIGWAQQAGEGEDYTDNLPMQCLHPVGHWYEIPNLLRNGTLREMLERQPSMKYLLLHNIDTLGASVDPGLLGLHIDGDQTLSYEVISRRLEDRGGGLARVNGRPRLVEGLAMPNEEAEFELSYYNSMTTWITIDGLLAAFGLSRSDLDHPSTVDRAVRRMAKRMPTYITLKDVKKRWGHGQEDIFPVAQFEKLWGDMSALPDVSCAYFVTPLQRGQQLKQQSQLDGWLRDGSAAAVKALCAWS
ncbi:MAG: UTP--glucose-1-phosphate uridylyltransferase [Planctomycetaceae bacterium]|nr:UTP--glucose-1-phosphate uridylyltransferase [Planctomycetaceae bacterium]